MQARESSKACFDICAIAPVIPVLVVDNTEYAQPLAEALVSGGLTVLEVTLRTPAALDVISAMAKTPGAVVGAGTLLTAEDVRAAKDAGAQFGVSPGATDTVLQAALDHDLPILPGAITPSEVMKLLEYGFDMLKFFPAEAAGGSAMLKSFSSPLPKAKFCPTGGINKQNVGQYLSLPNVICVGGSWVADSDLIREGEWGKIAMIASEAAAL